MLTITFIISTTAEADKMHRMQVSQLNALTSFHRSVSKPLLNHATKAWNTLGWRQRPNRGLI